MRVLVEYEGPAVREWLRGLMAEQGAGPLRLEPGARVGLTQSNPSEPGYAEFVVLAGSDPEFDAATARGDFAAAAAAAITVVEQTINIDSSKLAAVNVHAFRQSVQEASGT